MEQRASVKELKDNRSKISDSERRGRTSGSNQNSNTAVNLKDGDEVAFLLPFSTVNKARWTNKIN